MVSGFAAKETRPPLARLVDAWGQVSYSSEDAFQLLFEGISPEALCIRPDDATAVYNGWCETFDKGDHSIPPPVAPVQQALEMHAERAERWSIPERFRDLDVEDMLLKLCTQEAQEARVRLEMTMFAERGHVPLLRAMVALVAHFRQHRVVWGVGRGSSVASYCLFLIGIHRIDSLQYGLDIGEFLKPLQASPP